MLDNECSNKQPNKDMGGFLDLLDDTVSNNPVFVNLDQTKESLPDSTVSQESSSNSGIETPKHHSAK